MTLARAAGGRDRASPGTTCRLLFVGNFRHAPNADAARWLIDEIWPRVRPSLAGVELHIVGASAPAWLRTSQTPQFHLHEAISDADLAALYAQATVALVPLRYGAGVKGKVLDSLAGTIPLDKGVTIDLLRDRIPMMTDVRSVVTTSTQPLREIMSFIRRP